MIFDIQTLSGEKKKEKEDQNKSSRYPAALVLGLLMIDYHILIITDIICRYNK